jgi:hypothetical protein
MLWFRTYNCLALWSILENMMMITLLNFANSVFCKGSLKINILVKGY